MAKTYTLISSNVLGSSAASVTFSSIPSTYTDLVLRYSGRMDAGANKILKIQVAGADTSLSYTRIVGDPSIPSAASGFGTGISWAGYTDGSTMTASSFSSGEIYISNYASTSAYKAFSAYGAAEQNATDARMMAVAGLYSSNSAISSITLLDISTANWVSGSSFYLYGIKNS
jgi:hypothetical protein